MFITLRTQPSGGDLEPDSSASISGRVLSLPIKNYAVSFKKDDNRIYVSFKPSEICSNNIKYSVKI
ncbi:DUF6386 family protein [Aeromonas salmonicida]|uniref:DUF6386 family protein n=1 Tax=Aeromonas salmonicida TaxID=645 RepID=UPI003BAA04F0